ncbi:hypothetical protein AMJ80_02690 [bacterium SM23_31]|nr:MAG: hypothetical protein AMJ80_02690 [bacterium SM23_31]
MCRDLRVIFIFFLLLTLSAPLRLNIKLNRRRKTSAQLYKRLRKKKFKSINNTKVTICVQGEIQLQKNNPVSE